jgi:small subunit ribosomal protein S20
MKKNLSALKRDRQNEKRRLRNKSAKSKVFTYYKKVLNAVEEKNNKDEIMNAYKDWQKVLDKVVQKGIIQSNTASRRISRMMKKINELKLA